MEPKVKSRATRFEDAPMEVEPAANGASRRDTTQPGSSEWPDKRWTVADKRKTM